MNFTSEEERVACCSCHELYAHSDLDRYLWCPPCRKAMYRRGAGLGRIVGFATSLGVGLYVARTVAPPGRYMALYAALLVVTYLLLSRITLLLVQGYYRARGSIRSA